MLSMVTSSIKKRDLDTSVRPQDDFYQFANGGWLKRNKIPKTEARWGTFMELRLRTEKQLHAIVNELLGKKRVKKGTPEQMVGDFFRSGMDQKHRNELGVTPIDGLRDIVQNLTKREDLQTVITELHLADVGVLWDFGIDQDAKNSERYALHIAQGGLGLPDCDYYIKNDAESLRVRKAYVTHVRAILILAGYTKTEAVERSETIIKLETLLAGHWMNKEDRCDADMTYHKMSVKKISALAPTIDWKQYLADIDAGKSGDLIVMQPDFFKKMSTLIKRTSLEDLQVYFEWHVINNYAGLLSDAFVKQSFSFYGTTLSGTKHMKPQWRRVLGVVDGALGEVLGQIYVNKHFPPHAKNAMHSLVKDLFYAYEKRITVLNWMSPATKKKAVQKLRAMTTKVGYPDVWKSCRGLIIKPNDYVGNVMRTSRFEHKREMRKLGKKIDRKEWFMYPQTVNAYFAPSMNDIVFPAAILQPPFFDPDGDAAINYGAIGAVIGHEMTHGFDDQGAKYDHKGNLKTWWSAKDKKSFEDKTAVLMRQFNQYRVADGVKVNGKLTLGENVADLGGLVIALDAYRAHLEKNPSKNIGGYSPIERFFLGFALFERELARPEFQKTHALNDPHSPSQFRINGPVSNCDDFYKTFHVKNGDKLYRAPASRARIW